MKSVHPEMQGTIRLVTSADAARFGDLRPLLDAWYEAQGDAAALMRLCDLHAGPLACSRDTMAVVEREADGGFRYLHYGSAVAKHSGRDMTGQSTGGFESSAADFFATSYTAALAHNAPLYSVNRAVITHQTHSWQRLLLPVRATAPSDGDRVIALIRPLMGVRELLSDFARDSGILGGTLEPVFEDEQICDYVLQTLSDPAEVFGANAPVLLSDLFDRPLEYADIDRIATAQDGTTVVYRQVGNSLERFGRIFGLRISGGRLQPVFSLTDETELVRARDTAEQRKRQMEDFAQTASDWLWESDTEHRMSWITDAVEKATGSPASSYIGKLRTDFARHPENAAAFEQHIEDLKARRPFRDLVYRIRGADGQVRWLRVNGAPRFDAQGRFLGYRGTGSNITAEIVARRQADAERQRMEDFASVASDWLWETGPDHRITMITDAVYEKSGYPADYYIGKSRLDLGGLPANAGRIEAHRADLDARRPFKGFVYCSLSIDGQERWSRINGVPVFDADGTFLGYRGTGSNITSEIQAKRDLERQKKAMEEFADSASDWMWETDANDIFTMMSRRIEAVTGSPAERYVGVDWFDLEDVPENREAFAQNRQDRQARRPFRDFTYKAFTDDGRIMWVRTNGRPQFDEDGTYLGYRGTATDITEEVEARERAQRQAAELAEAHRVGQLGAWWLDRELGAVYFSEEFRVLAGLREDETSLPVARVLARVEKLSRQAAMKATRQALRGEEVAQVDVALRRGDGVMIDLSVTGRAERDPSGQVVRLLGTVQDISRRKQAERELERLAFSDPLTELGNRSAFNKALKAEFSRTLWSSDKTGLLLLDLDNFKEVNDTLGHGAGDELLRTAVGRIVASVGGEASVFRLGGDEFAVVARRLRSQADLMALGAGIRSAFSGAFALEDGAVTIGTSVGMVMIPDQTDRATEAMRYADLALYRAKALGRNRAVLFEPSLDDDVQDRVALTRDLRKALRADALDAHFQLQVDVIDGRITGFEALARWTHPERGQVPPSQFIPVAESSPLIGDLGAFMLRRACAQGKAWLDAGGAPLSVAVNVSVAQMWHRDVASDVREALQSTGFPPELLCVELTESVFEDGALQRIERLFADLKTIGVKLALDDFGTGYSSLKYLNALSFDKLKIDRSFVSNCDQDSEKRRLLQGIVALGQGLGMETVIEGVETEAELQIVCDMGCNTVQGHYFARPKPFHEACLDAAQIEADFGLRPVLWRARDEGLIERARRLLPRRKAAS